MKLKKLLLPFAVAGLCANAFAAPPSDASLARLFEVQNMDSLLDQSLRNAGGIVLSDPNVQRFLADAPAEKRPQLETVVKKYAAKAMARVNTPKVREQVRLAALNGMKTVYTQEEVDALIAFYSTPVGRSILDKTPRYLEATMRPVMNIMSEQYAKSNDAAQMVKEIRQIMCEGKDAAQACKQAKQGARKK